MLQYIFKINLKYFAIKIWVINFKNHPASSETMRWAGIGEPCEGKEYGTKKESKESVVEWARLR
jgi:hypothetical protein